MGETELYYLLHSIPDFILFAYQQYYHAIKYITWEDAGIIAD